MLASTQATDGPLTIGGLLQIVGTVHPDPQYQAAVAEQLAAVAYDNSAARQLGTCYFQAHLLELHGLLGTDDTSHAADLLDNASRGAQTAARFLERKPLDQADAGADDRASTLAEADDRDHHLTSEATDRDNHLATEAEADEAETDDRDGPLADTNDGPLADEAEADDRDGALADTCDGALASTSVGETDKPSNGPSMAARGPPTCAEASSSQARPSGKPNRLAQLIETPAAPQAEPRPWSGRARDTGDAALAHEAIGARLDLCGHLFGDHCQLGPA